MPRLPIALDDHWTQNRLTRVDRRGDAIGGCGVSLDVWRHLFEFGDGSWFAGVYGAYCDNLMIASLAQPDRFERTPFILTPEIVEQGNVSATAGDLGLHALTPAILERIGFSKLEDVEVNDDVVASVYIHDDFIFGLSRRRDGLIEQAIRMVVRVHEHFLDVDLPEDEELALTREIVDRLRREGGLQLRSNPGPPRSFRAIYERPLDGWLNRLFKRTRQIEEALPLPTSAC